VTEVFRLYVTVVLLAMSIIENVTVVNLLSCA